MPRGKHSRVKVEHGAQRSSDGKSADGRAPSGSVKRTEHSLSRSMQNRRGSARYSDSINFETWKELRKLEDGVCETMSRVLGFTSSISDAVAQVAQDINDFKFSNVSQQAVATYREAERIDNHRAGANEGVLNWEAMFRRAQVLSSRQSATLDEMRRRAAGSASAADPRRPMTSDDMKAFAMNMIKHHAKVGNKRGQGVKGLRSFMGEFQGVQNCRAPQ